MLPSGRTGESFCASCPTYKYTSCSYYRDVPLSPLLAQNLQLSTLESHPRGKLFSMPPPSCLCSPAHPQPQTWLLSVCRQHCQTGWSEPLMDFLAGESQYNKAAGLGVSGKPWQLLLPPPSWH